MSLNIEASGDFGRREGVFSVLPKGQEDRMCADIRGLPPLCSGLLSDGGNILAQSNPLEIRMSVAWGRGV